MLSLMLSGHGGGFLSKALINFALGLLEAMQSWLKGKEGNGIK